jgi:hypothetical protein
MSKKSGGGNAEIHTPLRKAQSDCKPDRGGGK